VYGHIKELTHVKKAVHIEKNMSKYFSVSAKLCTFALSLRQKGY